MSSEAGDLAIEEFGADHFLDCVPGGNGGATDSQAVVVKHRMGVDIDGVFIQQFPEGVVLAGFSVGHAEAVHHDGDDLRWIAEMLGRIDGWGGGGGIGSVGVGGRRGCVTMQRAGAERQ